MKQNNKIEYYQQYYTDIDTINIIKRMPGYILLGIQKWMVIRYICSVVLYYIQSHLYE